MEIKVNPDIPILKSSDSRVSVGRYTYGEPWLRLWTDNDRIEIGAFCSISSGVNIFGGGEHKSNWASTYPFRIVFNLEAANLDGHPATKGATKIGNDVWIGHGVTILSGVTIGDGSIIGANAVVAKNIPPYSIVVGNPARVIRKRFSKKKINKLMVIKWWNWDIETILDRVDFLCSEDIDALGSLSTNGGAMSGFINLLKGSLNVYK